MRSRERVSESPALQGSIMTPHGAVHNEYDGETTIGRLAVRAASLSCKQPGCDSLSCPHDLKKRIADFPQRVVYNERPPENLSTRPRHSRKAVAALANRAAVTIL
jgi:hypothetical protein